MKQYMLVAYTVCSMVALAHGVINNYNDLIGSTLQACSEPDIFLTVDYTNNVVRYRNNCTDKLMRSAANLALAISLMRRMDSDESCVSDNDCYELHQAIVSNIIADTELDPESWVKYAAGVEYVHGLNHGNRSFEGFVVSTNMLMQMESNPVYMGGTNFWNGMMLLQGCNGITPKMAFQLNAALDLAGRNRWTEVVAYTNALPQLLIEKFIDGLE